MCENCFEIEYQSFPSESEWLELDLALTKKLGSGKMNYVKVNANNDTIYECSTCKKSWKLREPDYSDRGYLLMI